LERRKPGKGREELFQTFQQRKVVFTRVVHTGETGYTRNIIPAEGSSKKTM